MFGNEESIDKRGSSRQNMHSLSKLVVDIVDSLSGTNQLIIANILGEKATIVLNCYAGLYTCCGLKCQLYCGSVSDSSVRGAEEGTCTSKKCGQYNGGHDEL